MSPNPTNGQCVLVANWLADGVVVVRDVAGRTVLTLRTKLGFKGEALLDLGQVRSGVYFLEMKQEARSEVIKVVKR